MKDSLNDGYRSIMSLIIKIRCDVNTVQVQFPWSILDYRVLIFFYFIPQLHRSQVSVSNKKNDSESFVKTYDHLVFLVYFILQEHPLWHKPVNVNSRLTKFSKEADKPLSSRQTPFGLNH